MPELTADDFAAMRKRAREATLPSERVQVRFDIELLITELERARDRERFAMNFAKAQKISLEACANERDTARAELAQFSVQTDPNRPFRYPEYSVYGAIERCDDLGKLRATAIAYHKAMQGQHELISHGPELNPCERCDRAVEHGDNSYACRLYRGRQKQYLDALRMF